MLLVKNEKASSYIREYRLMKKSANGKKKEYYCGRCHSNGRLVKVFVDVMPNGDEIVTVSKSKPHYAQCKGFPREIAANRQKGLENKYAK